MTSDEVASTSSPSCSTTLSPCLYVLTYPATLISALFHDVHHAARENEILLG